MNDWHFNYITKLKKKKCLKVVQANMHKTTNTSVVTRFSEGKKIILHVLLLEEITS